MNLKLRRPLLGILGALTGFGSLLGLVTGLKTNATKTEAAAATDLVQVTQISQISSANSYYIAAPAGDILYGLTSISGGKIDASTKEQDFVQTSVTKDASGDYFSISSDGLYLSSPGSGTDLETENSNNNNAALFYFSGDGSIAGKASESSKTKRGVLLRIQSSGIVFGNYALSNANYTEYFPAYLYVAANEWVFSHVGYEGTPAIQYIGLPFNDEGLTFAAYYEGQTEGQPIDESTITWSPSIIGADTKEVVGTWEGHTFTVSIAEPVERKADSISIAALPDKTSYIVGETLDLSGLKVSAHYPAGETIDVSSVVETAPADGEVLDTVGDVEVIVMFDDNITSFNVNVTSAWKHTFTSDDKDSIGKYPSKFSGKNMYFGVTPKNESYYLSYVDDYGLQIGSNGDPAKNVVLRSGLFDDYSSGSLAKINKVILECGKASKTKGTISVSINDRTISKALVTGQTMTYEFDFSDYEFSYGHFEFRFDLSADGAFYLKSIRVDYSDSEPGYADILDIVPSIETANVCDTSEENLSSLQDIVDWVDTFGDETADELLRNIYVDDFVAIGNNNHYSTTDGVRPEARNSAFDKLTVIRSVASGSIVWNSAYSMPGVLGEKSGAIIAAAVLVLMTLAAGSAFIIKRRRGEK